MQSEADQYIYTYSGPLKMWQFTYDCISVIFSNFCTVLTVSKY